MSIDETTQRVAKAIYEADNRGKEPWDYWLEWPCGGSHTFNQYISLAKSALSAIHPTGQPVGKSTLK